MKKLLTLILIGSTLTLVGCLKTDVKNYIKFLDEQTAGNTYGGDIEYISYRATDPNRFVLKLTISYGDIVYEGFNFSGVDFKALKEAVLNETNPNDKLMAGTTFLENIYISDLNYSKIDKKFYDDNSELFSEVETSLKDLESFGARMEDSIAEGLGEKLTDLYGLSAERGKSVAKTIKSFKKLSSKRSLTEREKNNFSKELLGVEYAKAEDAFLNLKGGSIESFNNLLDTAADVNGTSPEQVSAIINELFL